MVVEEIVGAKTVGAKTVGAKTVWAGGRWGEDTGGEDPNKRRLHYPSREDRQDQYGRWTSAAPWHTEGYVPGSTKGEGGYSMEGGVSIPPSHLLNLVVPFTAQELDYG